MVTCAQKDRLPAPEAWPWTICEALSDALAGPDLFDSRHGEIIKCKPSLSLIPLKIHRLLRGSQVSGGLSFLMSLPAFVTLPAG